MVAGKGRFVGIFSHVYKITELLILLAGIGPRVDTGRGEEEHVIFMLHSMANTNIKVRRKTVSSPSF